MCEIFTVDDVARLLHCDAETAATHLLNGDLPGLKFGRGWIVPADAFFQRLNEWAVEAAAIRKAERESHAAPAKSRAVALTSMVVANSTTGRRGRPRKVLPDLSQYLPPASAPAVTEHGAKAEKLAGEG